MTFSQTGGVRIGKSAYFALNATSPFARLIVKESELTLKFLWWTWILPKRSIRSLRKYSGLFSTGLRIEHSVARCPAFIVFWTFEYAALKQELERRGYMVSAE